MYTARMLHCSLLEDPRDGNLVGTYDWSGDKMGVSRGKLLRIASSDIRKVSFGNSYCY